MENNVQHFEKAQAVASANFMNADGKAVTDGSGIGTVTPTPFLKQSVNVFGLEMSKLSAIIGGIIVIGVGYYLYKKSK